jgi:TonB family protein
VLHVEAVMTEVPQKLRTGIVELRTDVGPRYVTLSLWERIYLLWTFRNFHSLPKQVLNRRQQQLIDELCRSAMAERNGASPGDSIIGVVENVRWQEDCITEAATATSKLIEMNTATPDIIVPQAVGSEGIVTRSAGPYRRTDVSRFGQNSNLQSISTSREDSTRQSEPGETSTAPVDSNAGLGRGRNRLGWAALVVVCSAALLGVLSYLREGRAAASRTIPPVSAEADRPPARSVPHFTAARPEIVQPSAPMEPSESARTFARKPEVPPSTADQTSDQTSDNSETVIPTPPVVARTDSTPLERLQLAERPVGRFTYPVAPNASQTGKVTLKAVVGTDGNVREVEILSGDRALGDAAARAVRQWRYLPHERNGHAVEVETNVAISFIGDDVVSITFPASH